MRNRKTSWTLIGNRSRLTLSFPLDVSRHSRRSNPPGSIHSTRRLFISDDGRRVHEGSTKRIRIRECTYSASVSLFLHPPAKSHEYPRTDSLRASASANTRSLPLLLSHPPPPPPLFRAIHLCARGDYLRNEKHSSCCWEISCLNIDTSRLYTRARHYFGISRGTLRETRELHSWKTTNKA